MPASPAHNSITVIFEPLGNIAGVEIYHETLEYVDASGNVSYMTSGPTNNPQTNSLTTMSSAATAASTGNVGADPYGAMFCVSGNSTAIINQVGLTTFNAQTSSSNDSATITNAATQAEWSSITSSCNSIEAAGFAYSPMTQNSNSVASTALKDAGLTPAENGLFHADYTPGSGNILAIPGHAASDGDQTTTSTGPTGTITTSITEEMNGRSNDITDVTFTAGATAGANGFTNTAAVGHDGVTYDNDTQQWKSANSEVESISGKNFLDNNATFTESINDSNGTFSAGLTGGGASLDMDNGSIGIGVVNNDAVFGDGNSISGGNTSRLSTLDVAGQSDHVTASYTATKFLGFDYTADSVSGYKSTATDGGAAFGYGTGLVTGGNYGTYSGSGGSDC